MVNVNKDLTISLSKYVDTFRSYELLDKFYIK